MQRAAATLACALAVTALAGSDPASAAARPYGDRVCAPRANLYESPGGLQIGVIAGGRPVVVLGRTHNGRWARVRTTIRARGWVRSGTLCGED